MSEPIERSLFEAPPIAEQERMVEAILFASTEPVTVAELAACCAMLRGLGQVAAG